MGTELTWYVAVPVIALLIHALVGERGGRTSFRVQALLLVSSLPIAHLFRAYAREQEWQDAPMWLPSYLYCFCLGALVGLALEAEREGIITLTRTRRVLGMPGLLLTATVLMLVLTCSPLAGPPGLVTLTFQEQVLRNLFACGLALVLLAAGLFSPPGALLMRLLSTRWMQATGRWSYGIYLWHVPLIVLLWQEVTFPSGVLGLVTWLVVVGSVSCALGAATWVWVEKPAIAWSHSQSLPTPAPEAVVASDVPVTAPATASESPAEALVEAPAEAMAAAPAGPVDAASLDPVPRDPAPSDAEPVEVVPAPAARIGKHRAH